jgi:hypothetical protein
MRAVQTILDFFSETPQAYFCDRCGECHRAGECRAVEKTAPREPKEGTLPRKPGEKRKRRIQKKKEKKRGSFTEPTGSAGPRQGSAAWSKDRYIRDDEDQAI